MSELSTTSARLFYLPLEPIHAAELQAALCDPRVYEFISSGAPRDREELERQFARMTAGAPAHRSDEEWWNFTVRRLDSGEAIGRLETTLIGTRAEIAYVFGPAHWGNGYGTEALRWMHGRLAESSHLTEFWATIHPDNKPSHRLLERNGYQEAFDGNWPDLASYDPGDRVFRHDVTRWTRSARGEEFQS